MSFTGAHATMTLPACQAYYKFDENIPSYGPCGTRIEAVQYFSPQNTGVGSCLVAGVARKHQHVLLGPLRHQAKLGKHVVLSHPLHHHSRRHDTPVLVSQQVKIQYRDEVCLILVLENSRLPSCKVLNLYAVQDFAAVGSPNPDSPLGRCRLRSPSCYRRPPGSLPWTGASGNRRFPS